MNEVVFVGAGPGDPELITVKGKRAIEAADIIIYAGSLVPKDMLAWASTAAELIDSAALTFEEITEIFGRAARDGKKVVRLHSGDPSLYGAIQEQIDWLSENGLGFTIVPGVTAAFAAAAAIGRELTMPEVSQTVIFARAEGRTPVPEGQDIRSLAAIKGTLCLYLSIDKAEEIAASLLSHYPPETPVAIVYHASRPTQKVWSARLADLPEAVAKSGIKNTAMIIVGRALEGKSARSKLYDKEFSHGCRE